MFRLEAIRHEYDGAPVLDLPQFQGDKGEHCLVLGRSGSGKTTLLHLMAGLIRPTGGRVEIAGQDLARLSGAALDHFRGATIGIVFQRLHLLPTLTVVQNLQLARYLAGLPQEAGRVNEVLESLGIGDKRQAYPSEMSQGQQQRAAIARAVINKPALILADEPTSALDDLHTAQVLELVIAQAEAHDATLVVATHDRRVMSRFDRQLTLDEPEAARAGLVPTP
jgi:putative ABC transport system ATP-binding protein